MGRLNLKLMQGIEESEKQIQKEKQPQKSPVPEAVAEEKPAGRLSDKAKKPSEAVPQPKVSPKKEREKISPKQVFSFRATLSDINMWKAYATATGEKTEHIGCMAMNEYIKRHKLTGAELAVFEAVWAREENSKISEKDREEK